MERLMNQILSNVYIKEEDPEQEQPIDLSWSKFTRHTCDRFIEQEDLRHNADDDITTRGNVGRSMCSFSSSDSEEPVPMKTEVTSPKRPHPFSIDALLGNLEEDRPDVLRSAPAQISCSYVPEARSVSNVQSNDRFPGASSPDESVEDEGYWCHACNVLCIDFDDAARHQLVHQMQGTRCSLKSAVFLQSGYVTCHRRFGPERLRCGICEKAVASCFFSKHQRLHEGHFCDVCRQEFSSNSRLQDHMNTHSGRTPFRCYICDRKFAKRSSFTQHMRYHRDHKSYPCHYCPKSFNTKYACAVHERLHTGENPFRCEVPGCGKSYPQKIQLQLHVSSHH